MMRTTSTMTCQEGNGENKEYIGTTNSDIVDSSPCHRLETVCGVT